PGSAHQFSFLALTSNDRLGMLFKRPITDDPNQTGGLDLRAGFSQLRLKHRWQHDMLSIDTVAMFEAQQVHNSIGNENVDVNGTSFMLRSTAAVEVSEKLAVVGGMDASASHYLVSARLPRSTLRLEG